MRAGAETLPQGFSQVGESRHGDEFLIEANEASLTALLKQPGQLLGAKLSTGAARALQVTPRATMHEQAARNLDHEHGSCRSRAIRKPETLDVGRQRRIDAVVASGMDELLDTVEVSQVHAEDLARFVLHTQHTKSAARIGKGRQFIGQPIGMRGHYPPAFDPDFLEFEGAVW